MQGIFRPEDYPDLLVGLSDPDDAAIWRLDDERALVATTDFFTPVVDDPYDYGAIAAANALSDVYAMGGKPFLALNIAALPPDLPVEISAQILRGGAEKAREAGVVLAGGHTVQDKEPKYGLMVLGFVRPGKALTKKGARPGDVLFLSKPLGFGAATTALKRGLASQPEIAEVVYWMKQLNRTVSELAAQFELRGGTDITGFGLLGHACEMANASRVRFQFSFAKFPWLTSAAHFAQEWIFPGGSADNRLYFQDQVDFDPEINEVNQMLLFDAQTSGGLLLAVPAASAQTFLAAATQAGQPLWQVGDVIEGAGIQVNL